MQSAATGRGFVSWSIDDRTFGKDRDRDRSLLRHRWCHCRGVGAGGFTVFGTSRRTTGNGPAGVSMLACDVTDDDSVAALVATVISQTGRIDVLVNNAGMGLIGGAEESSIAQVRALFDVNLFGTMRMTNAVLPSMRRRGQGRIINIGSIVGLVPAPYSTHYSAIKHALEGYSESLDHEVRAFGIRISLIEPAGNAQRLRSRTPLAPDVMLPDDDRARADANALDEEGCWARATTRRWWPTRCSGPSPTPARGGATPPARSRGQVSLLRRFGPAGLLDKSLRKQLRLPV